jgi:hypothetical protein
MAPNGTVVPGGPNMNAPLLPSLALGALVLSAAGAATAADATPLEERVTRTSEGLARDHAADELRDPQSLETTRRAAADIEQKPRTGTGASAKGLSSTRSVYGDSYIYDASTTLFDDFDGDGYYHYLRVRLDADTVFTYSYVYAEIYLSADGNAWEHLYTTKDFAVWGADPNDDYEVETELVSGYSTGLYDVLIQLYDADTGTLVDEFGPSESSALSLLPLEDSARDGVIAPAPDSHSHGGGGAFSWLVLPGLLGALLLKRRAQRRRPLLYTRRTPTRQLREDQGDFVTLEAKLDWLAGRTRFDDSRLAAARCGAARPRSRDRARHGGPVPRP